MSETSNNLTGWAAIGSALVEAQAHCKQVAKAGQSPDGYEFARADDVIAAGRAALNAAGLALLPTKLDVVEFLGGLAVLRSLTLFHRSGANVVLEVRWPIHIGPGKPRDKAVAAADTSALAYCYRDLLGIDRVVAGEVPMDSRRDEGHESGTDSSAKPVAVSAVGKTVRGPQSGAGAFAAARARAASLAAVEELRAESGQPAPSLKDEPAPWDAAEGAVVIVHPTNVQDGGAVPSATSGAGVSPAEDSTLSPSTEGPAPLVNPTPEQVAVCADVAARALANVGDLEARTLADRIAVWRACKLTKARKVGHACAFCGRIVEPGDMYRRKMSGQVAHDVCVDLVEQGKNPSEAVA